MVKAQMAEKEMTPVDWGGDIEFIGYLQEQVMVLKSY